MEQTLGKNDKDIIIILEFGPWDKQRKEAKDLINWHKIQISAGHKFATLSNKPSEKSNFYFCQDKKSKFEISKVYDVRIQSNEHQKIQNCSFRRTISCIYNHKFSLYITTLD